MSNSQIKLESQKLEKSMGASNTKGPKQVSQNGLRLLIPEDGGLYLFNNLHV